MKALTKLLLLLVAIACGLFFFCTAHSLDSERLSQIEVGMPASEVQQILGEPGELCAYENDARFISYRKLGRWCSVDITLDSDGNVASIFHDH